MYLRHTTRRKDGKTHVYWQLVRSVCLGRKVRQETVAQLGELDAEGRARARRLARKISGRAIESLQGRLFEPTAPTEAAAVRLDAIRMENSRSFGAVWLGWVLWHSLKLDQLLEGLLPRGRETVSWADVIAILVIGRLCEPSSELHVAERWYRTTALEDLFGIASERLYEERLYRGVIERQVGRFLQRNSRAAGGFSIAITDDEHAASGLMLSWRHNPEWDQWARLSEGVYILRTNICEWTDEALWNTYTQLTEAEAAFRVQKSDLAIRPIWHHKADRIKAHILVCFLGYALWKTLQQWQSRAGLGHSPRTILEELSRIHAADIVLPLADASKRELRIRCVVRPDREQAILLQHLGLTLPERLRPPKTPEM